MRREDRIEEGDKVTVEYGASGEFLLPNQTVLYVPSSNGEAWVFKGPAGDVVYLSQFLSMRKLAEDTVEEKK
jgi:hypothetical protein